MRLYLKDGNELKIDDNLKLKLINVDDFVSVIKSASGKVPTPHIKASLEYKLISNEGEYSGVYFYDTYDSIKIGIKNNIDEKCPYRVNLNDWCLSDDKDKYFEFVMSDKKDDLINVEELVRKIDAKLEEINKELAGKKASELLSDRAYELLDLPMIMFSYGEIQFFRKHEIDKMQNGFRNNPDTGEMYEEWAGREFVLVGWDATAGVGPDQYIVNTASNKLPVYWLMTDGGDWKHPKLICDSLEKFSKIMRMLVEYDKSLYDGLTKELKDEIYNKIVAILDTDKVSDYWNTLLNNAYFEKE